MNLMTNLFNVIFSFRAGVLKSFFFSLLFLNLQIFFVVAAYSQENYVDSVYDEQNNAVNDNSPNNSLNLESQLSENFEKLNQSSKNLQEEDNLPTEVVKQNLEDDSFVKNENESTLDESEIIFNAEDFTKFAVIKGLNKVTARTSKIVAEVDKIVEFGNLDIILKSCWRAPPHENPESKALIDVWEQIPGEEKKRVFFGWMFASSMSVSSPEHPVYDLSLIECFKDPSMENEAKLDNQ